MSVYRQDNERVMDSHTPRGTHKSFISYAAVLLISTVVGVCIYGFPIVANAGIFSFITDAHAEQDNRGESRLNGVNVQNMKLLQAPNNRSLAGAYGGGDIFIQSDNALRSNGRPGTDQLEDVSDKSGRIRVYIVREGDTLSEIANMFDVTANTIRWSNEIAIDQAITPGQKLVILPITGVRYSVKKGDTISSITKKFDGSADEIREFNGLESDGTLSIGDKIIIPNGELGVQKRGSEQDHQRKSAPSAPAPSYNQPSNVSGGYYAHPAPGAIVTQRTHGYNAIDFGAPAGTPIIASAPGRVIISRNGGWNGGYGTYVVIDHENGTQTLYSHNRQNSVRVGQYVERGQVIAYMGSTGRSTGNHVHFEVRGATNPFRSCGLRSSCR